MSIIIMVVLIVLLLILLLLLPFIDSAKVARRKQTKRLHDQGEQISIYKAEHPTEATAEKTQSTDAKSYIQYLTPKLPPPELMDFKLIHESQLTAHLREKVLAMTNSIPRPRKILVPLTRGIDDARELADIVKTDPEVAAKILRAVNSAAYRLPAPVSSINYAITYLGMDLVRDIAMQLAIQSNIKVASPTLNAAYDKLWVSSFIASSFALRMAQILGLRNPSELSTQALLSSIGNLAILAYRPALAVGYASPTSLFERTKTEQENLQANTAVVGALLAKQWELPKSVIHTIRHSLTPMAIAPKDCNLTVAEIQEMVFCYVACRLGDLVAMHNLADIGQANLIDQTGLEYVYLTEYLKKGGLESLIENLKNNSLRPAINQQIRQLKGS